MKKILSFIFLLGIPAFMMAQVFSDNFDSYTAGKYLGDEATGTHWSTWNDMPGTGEDGTISDKYAASAPNSLQIKENVDVIYNFEGLHSGHYTISFKYLVPEESTGGYFNGMHEYGTSGSAYAFECRFNNDGTGYLTVNNEQTNFTTAKNDWFPIVIDINFDEDTATLTIDDNFVAGWPFHYTSVGSGLYEKLAILDFYGTAPNGVTAGAVYYIDDFSITENTVGVNDHQAPQVSIYPNPATSSINISADQMSQVELYNLVGQKVYETVCTENSISIPTCNLTAGTYIVKIMSEKGISTKKVVVK